jgi:hypothetical protein
VIPDAETIGKMIDTALDMKSANRPRTQQSRAGWLGPSDLGFCRALAVLKVKQTPPSDVKKMRAADWGTALHEWIEDAVKTAFPTWVTEERSVTATYSIGKRVFKVTGTPDIIVPEWNAILDLKGVDGFQYVKRNGASQNHKFQRHTYAKGAVESGLLNGDEPVYVGNVYFDRSARENNIYVGEIVETEPWLDDEIARWLEDVAYAVEQGDDGHQDIAPAVCAQICEFFSVCRGHLPDEDATLITDPGLIDAARMYDEGKALEKQAKKMKSEAQTLLWGHSGLAGDFQVRWTTVAESDVPGFHRSGYTRLDVVRVAK